MGTKITALPPILTVENTDVLPIVDITDTTTKKITIAQIETKLSASFLSSGDNISLLTNDSGFITVSDFSNDGENAGVDRDLGNLDAFALSFITSGVGRINIEAGGNVGIGTSTPTESLDVVGNTKISGNITQTDATAETSLANGDIYMDSVAAFGIPAIWLDQTGAKTLTNASFWQTGTLQGHSVATGGQFQFRINDQASQGMTLKEPNGNVHAAYLSVGNTSLTNKYISLGGGQYGLGIRSGALGINTLSTGKIFFSGYDGSTTPTDLMTIDAATGNVGIGTSTPTEKLDVNGRQFLSDQTAPSTPTGGGTIFVDGGALKYIGSSGTITTLGVA